jgi:hypothetical protein
VVDQLKSSVSLVLWGQFLGLVLVGRAVWNMIKPAAAKPAATVSRTAPLADIPKPVTP